MTIALPDDITEGTYHVVIVISSQPENEPKDKDDTPNEIVLEGIREGLKQAFSDQTIPLNQMWEGINIE